MFRMFEQNFQHLLTLLWTSYGLQGSQRITSKKVLVIMLYILAYNESMRYWSPLKRHQANQADMIRFKELWMQCYMNHHWNPPIPPKINWNGSRSQNKLTNLLKTSSKLTFINTLLLLLDSMTNHLSKTTIEALVCIMRSRAARMPKRPPIVKWIVLLYLEYKNLYITQYNVWSLKQNDHWHACTNIEVRETMTIPNVLHSQN